MQSVFGFLPAEQMIINIGLGLSLIVIGIVFTRMLVYLYIGWAADELVEPDNDDELIVSL